MFHYTLINIPKTIDIETHIIDTIFSKIASEEIEPHIGTLNIVCMSDDAIQNLNNTYRQKNTSTDVLSFHYFDDFSNLSQETIAWEIILSESKILGQWKEYWLWSTHECYKLIIHSIFHILGYDHIQDDEYLVMKEKEEKIWNQVFKKK